MLKISCCSNSEIFQNNFINHCNVLGHLRAAASVLRRGHTDLETIVDKDNKVAPILCVFLIIFYSDHFGHRVLFNTKSSFQVIYICICGDKLTNFEIMLKYAAIMTLFIKYWV